MSIYIYTHTCVFVHKYLYADIPTYTYTCKKDIKKGISGIPFARASIHPLSPLSPQGLRVPGPYLARKLGESGVMVSRMGPGAWMSEAGPQRVS